MRTSLLLIILFLISFAAEADSGCPNKKNNGPSGKVQELSDKLNCLHDKDLEASKGLVAVEVAGATILEQRKEAVYSIAQSILIDTIGTISMFESGANGGEVSALDGFSEKKCNFDRVFNQCDSPFLRDTAKKIHSFSEENSSSTQCQSQKRSLKSYGIEMSQNTLQTSVMLNELFKVENYELFLIELKQKPEYTPLQILSSRDFQKKLRSISPGLKSFFHRISYTPILRQAFGSRELFNGFKSRYLQQKSIKQATGDPLQHLLKNDHGFMYQTAIYALNRCEQVINSFIAIACANDDEFSGYSDVKEFNDNFINQSRKVKKETRKIMSSLEVSCHNTTIGNKFDSVRNLINLATEDRFKEYDFLQTINSEIQKDYNKKTCSLLKVECHNHDGKEYCEREDVGVAYKKAGCENNENKASLEKDICKSPEAKASFYYHKTRIGRKARIQNNRKDRSRRRAWIAKYINGTLEEDDAVFRSNRYNKISVKNNYDEYGYNDKYAIAERRPVENSKKPVSDVASGIAKAEAAPVVSTAEKPQINKATPVNQGQSGNQDQSGNQNQSSNDYNGGDMFINPQHEGAYLGSNLAELEKKFAYNEEKIKDSNNPEGESVIKQRVENSNDINALLERIKQRQNELNAGRKELAELKEIAGEETELSTAKSELNVLKAEIKQAKVDAEEKIYAGAIKATTEAARNLKVSGNVGGKNGVRFRNIPTKSVFPKNNASKNIPNSQVLNPERSIQNIPDTSITTKGPAGKGINSGTPGGTGKKATRGGGGRPSSGILSESNDENVPDLSEFKKGVNKVAKVKDLRRASDHKVEKSIDCSKLGSISIEECIKSMGLEAKSFKGYVSDKKGERVSLFCEYDPTIMEPEKYKSESGIADSIDGGTLNVGRQKIYEQVRVFRKKNMLDKLAEIRSNTNCKLLNTANTGDSIMSVDEMMKEAASNIK